jgi:hypothetical protein
MRSGTYGRLRRRTNHSAVTQPASMHDGSEQQRDQRRRCPLEQGCPSLEQRQHPIGEHRQNHSDKPTFPATQAPGSKVRHSLQRNIGPVEMWAVWCGSGRAVTAGPVGVGLLLPVGGPNARSARVSELAHQLPRYFSEHASPVIRLRLPKEPGGWVPDVARLNRCNCSLPSLKSTLGYARAPDPNSTTLQRRYSMSIPSPSPGLPESFSSGPSPARCFSSATPGTS